MIFIASAWPYPTLSNYIGYYNNMFDFGFTWIYRKKACLFLFLSLHRLILFLHNWRHGADFDFDYKLKSLWFLKKVEIIVELWSLNLTLYSKWFLCWTLALLRHLCCIRIYGNRFKVNVIVYTPFSGDDMNSEVQRL